MIDLSDDIVVEILLRMPVKSLLRFRCVWKRWRSLIKTPHFIHRHHTLRRARGDEHLLLKRIVKPSKNFHAHEHVLHCYGVFESLDVLTAPPDFDFDTKGYIGVHIVFSGYVNGVVCLTDYTTVTLLNPSLKEFRTLPARSFGCAGGSYAIGFGLDDTTNDYKVVRCIEYRSLTSSGQAHCEAEVYSVRTDSWKELGNVPEFDVSLDCSPVFFNRCVHWLASPWGNRHDHCILTFNMTTELFQDMQLPEDLKAYESRRLKGLFVVDRSTIALVAFTDPCGLYGAGDLVNVWVMKEYGVRESWIKQYSITPSLKIEKPLSFWKKDKLVLVTTNNELVYYDLPNGEQHLVVKHDLLEGTYPPLAWSLGMVICTESLFPIKQALE